MNRCSPGFTRPSRRAPRTSVAPRWISDNRPRAGTSGPPATAPPPSAPRACAACACTSSRAGSREARAARRRRARHSAPTCGVSGGEAWMSGSRRRRRLPPPGSGDVDLDHVRRAGDVHGGPGGDHDPVALLDDAGVARRRRSRAPRAPGRRRASLTSSGITPHSSAICWIAYALCVSATIGRCGRSRATADAVRPVAVGTMIAAARERLGEVAGGVRHRAADRRLLARPPASRGGSRGSARPRARSGPCTRPPRPGTRRPPSRRRA